MSDQKLKVAILGASGIGKNHARWFHQHGCDVAAFLGSSPQSVERTRALLEKGFGFSGRGYVKLSDLLSEERPDAVCVSSPPPLHFDQVMQCLNAGAHVLCEKPLVYDAALSPDELIEQGRQLVLTAEECGLLLGTQTQYAVAVDALLELSGHAQTQAPVRDFVMEMESKNVKAGRGFETIWIDLSPHPLSVLQKLTGDAEIEADFIDCRVRELETDARFALRRADGIVVQARIVVRCNPGASVPLRRFTLDGQSVDYAGRNNAQGEFRSYLSAGEQQRELPDFVDMLIGNFVAACQGREPLAVTGTDGARNVEWQLKIIEAGQRL